MYWTYIIEDSSLTYLLRFFVLMNKYLHISKVYSQFFYILKFELITENINSATKNNFNVFNIKKQNALLFIVYVYSLYSLSWNEKKSFLLKLRYNCCRWCRDEGMKQSKEKWEEKEKGINIFIYLWPRVIFVHGTRSWDLPPNQIEFTETQRSRHNREDRSTMLFAKLSSQQ